MLRGLFCSCGGSEFGSQNPTGPLITSSRGSRASDHLGHLRSYTHIHPTHTHIIKNFLKILLQKVPSQLITRQHLSALSIQVPDAHPSCSRRSSSFLPIPKLPQLPLDASTGPHCVAPPGPKQPGRPAGHKHRDLPAPVS